MKAIFMYKICLLLCIYTRQDASVAFNLMCKYCTVIRSLWNGSHIHVHRNIMCIFFFFWTKLFFAFILICLMGLLLFSHPIA